MSSQDHKKPLALKNILVIPFVMVISISVVLTSYITLQYSEKTSLKLGIQISEKSSEIVKSKLDNYFDVANTSNQSLKSVIKYGFLDVNDRDKTLDYITDIVKNNKKVGTLSFAYPDGSYMGISNTNTRNNALLKKIASPETQRMFYTYNMSSNKIIQQKKDYDARIRPWYIEAKRVNKPVWSPVFEMFSNGKLGITFSESLYKNGEFLGVLGTDVVFYDLNEQLNNIRLTDKAYLFIIDEYEHLIAQSITPKRSESELVKISDSHDSILKGSLQYIKSAQKASDEACYKNIAITVDGKVEQYFISLIPYSHGNGMNWHIGIVIPQSDFLGGFGDNRRNTFIFWMVSFLFSICVGLIITYIISKSIKSLKLQVDTIKHGVELYEHQFYYIKEINDLSIAFSHMSYRLKKTAIESHTDALTQIANRRAYDQQLNLQWTKLENNQINNIILLMLDIDHFKEYNDLYGHIVGDSCLCSLAKVLMEVSDNNQFSSVARIGGEEFVVILSNYSIQQAQQFASDIIDRLAREKIQHQASPISEYLTVSIGLACSRAHPSQSGCSLMKKADIALYLAKKTGKNRYCIYKAKKNYFKFKSL